MKERKNNMEDIVLVRHSPPTKHDTVAKGTRCIVIEQGHKTIYEQMSVDENEPKWVLITHTN